MSSTTVRQLQLDELPGLEGEKLGTSEWHEITQSQVQMFADATGDQQWIHVDPERAKSGPFGGPVAHGFLTLSLEPVLLDEIFAVAGGGTVVNYGLNKVRFPAPVPVGGKVRMHATLTAAQIRPDGSLEAILKLEFELEGGSKPVCVAESIFRYIPNSD
jgi:acyl dehydratase